jgi:hypothetical protein
MSRLLNRKWHQGKMARPLDRHGQLALMPGTIS